MSSTAPSHLPTTTHGWTRTLMVSLGAATVAAAATYAITQEDLSTPGPAPVVVEGDAQLPPLGERVPGEEDILRPGSFGADVLGGPADASPGRAGGPIAGW